MPGRRRRSQVLAVQQLLRGGGPMWDKHAAAVSRHDGTSVISMELLGPARDEVVATLRDAVQVDGATEVEVVITARDLNRSIPSRCGRSPSRTAGRGAGTTTSSAPAADAAERPLR